MKFTVIIILFFAAPSFCLAQTKNLKTKNDANTQTVIAAASGKAIAFKQKSGVTPAAQADGPGSIAELHNKLANQVRAHLVKNIEYPETRIAGGIEGMVVVEVQVSKKGKIHQSAIARSLHPDFDAAVLKALSSLKAVVMEEETGQRVPKILVPIKFSLNK